MTIDQKTTNCTEVIALVALLNDEHERAYDLLRQLERSELHQLRHAMFVGTAMVDRILKEGDHA